MYSYLRVNGSIYNIKGFVLYYCNTRLLILILAKYMSGSYLYVSFIMKLPCKTYTCMTDNKIIVVIPPYYMYLVSQCKTHIQTSIFYSYYRKPVPPVEIFTDNLERLKNIISSGLGDAMKTQHTIEMRHDFFRRIIKRKTIVLNKKTFLEETDFHQNYFPVGWNSSFITKRGDQRTILCAEGEELPQRWIEKLTISFVKQTH